MTKKLYRHPLAALGTFTYHDWEGEGTIAHVADYEGHRYFLVHADVPLPTSNLAAFELVDLTSELATQLRPVAMPDTINQIVSKDEVLQTALRDIDLAAGQARTRYITEVPGQQATYLAKAEQAATFKAAGYEGEAPAYVKMEAQATGMTAKQATDTILATKAAWETTTGPRIEYLRRSGKITVTRASTVEEIEATARKVLAELGGI